MKRRLHIPPGDRRRAWARPSCLRPPRVPRHRRPFAPRGRPRSLPSCAARLRLHCRRAPAPCHRRGRRCRMRSRRYPCRPHALHSKVPHRPRDPSRTPTTRRPSLAPRPLASHRSHRAHLRRPVPPWLSGPRPRRADRWRRPVDRHPFPRRGSSARSVHPLRALRLSGGAKASSNSTSAASVRASSCSRIASKRSRRPRRLEWRRTSTV